MGLNFAKSTENQTLRTFDLISLFILLFLVSCSIYFVLSRRSDASRMERAQAEMKHLSHQILDEGLKPLRGPASVASQPSLGPEGRISRDPWGHPYYYKVLSSDDGKNRVIVWSSGPDGVPETREWDFRLGSEKSALAINYRGDDVGYFTR